MPPRPSPFHRVDAVLPHEAERRSRLMLGDGNLSALLLEVGRAVGRAEGLDSPPPILPTESLVQRVEHFAAQYGEALDAHPDSMAQLNSEFARSLEPELRSQHLARTKRDWARANGERHLRAPVAASDSDAISGHSRRPLDRSIMWTAHNSQRAALRRALPSQPRKNLAMSPWS